MKLTDRHDGEVRVVVVPGKGAVWAELQHGGPGPRAAAERHLEGLLQRKGRRCPQRDRGLGPGHGLLEGRQRFGQGHSSAGGKVVWKIVQPAQIHRRGGLRPQRPVRLGQLDAVSQQLIQLLHKGGEALRIEFVEGEIEVEVKADAVPLDSLPKFAGVV